jgi:hypothetical protein
LRHKEHSPKDRGAFKPSLADLKSASLIPIAMALENSIDADIISNAHNSLGPACKTASGFKMIF